MSAYPSIRRLRHAFTLVEVMLSTGIIVIILLVLVSVTTQTSTLWRRTTGKIEQFREARGAFDTMTTCLSQATLNTYWDYFDSNGKPRDINNTANFVPSKYGRQAELLFISGQAGKILGDANGGVRVSHCVFFHAPLGLTEDAKNTSNTNYRSLNNLLNVWGYYVEFQDDLSLLPKFIADTNPPPRYRFRLMEFMQPTQKLQTYLPNATWLNGISNPGAAQYNWFKSFANVQLSAAPVHVLSENIIALIIRPQLSKQDIDQQKKLGKTAELTKDYTYDTRYDPVGSKGKYTDPMLNPVNQLPPILQITMVAIDEQSASVLNLKSGSDNIFNVKSRFTDPANYDTNLFHTSGSTTSLEDDLIKLKTSYRIFSTNVPIRGAKWSRAQTN